MVTSISQYFWARPTEYENSGKAWVLSKIIPSCDDVFDNDYKQQDDDNMMMKIV